MNKLKESLNQILGILIIIAIVLIVGMCTINNNLKIIKKVSETKIQLEYGN